MWSDWFECIDKLGYLDRDDLLMPDLNEIWQMTEAAADKDGEGVGSTPFSLFVSWEINFEKCIECM